MHLTLSSHPCRGRFVRGRRPSLECARCLWCRLQRATTPDLLAFPAAVGRITGYEESGLGFVASMDGTREPSHPLLSTPEVAVTEMIDVAVPDCIRAAPHGSGDAA